MKDTPKGDAVAYERPEVKEYGDLRELTAASLNGTRTDVPSGSPAPFVFSG
jgi:hypothetical protein